MNLLRILALMTLLFALGCSSDDDKGVTAQTGNNGDVVQSSDKLISNRPIKQEAYVALMRLETPALLENPTFNADGTVKFDPALAGKILIEQERVISDLKQISNNVQIIFRYRHVLNALAVLIPEGKHDDFAKVMGVTEIRPTNSFYSPKAISQSISKAINIDLLKRNPTKFIGATDAHNYMQATDADGQKVALRGQGIKVGIIDTGIDYTHKLFGGAGTAESYAAINPNEDTDNDGFPSAKVVGGYDFAGTDFHTGSPIAANRIPKPDNNPLDEQGHGTHVAGTVAGVGDYEVSHDGVAPGAELYALKVFGKSGSTSDAVVIASIEYSMDPNKDLDSSDRLDVVNLSLGGDNGLPYLMYTEAIRNAVKGGLSVVAAAGNAGGVDFIVGAPSTSDEALSVAASIDDSFHNWRFPSVKFTGTDREPIFVKRVEGDISTPIDEVGDLSGELHYIGLAKDPLTDEQKAELAGKVALIDRGEVTFVHKLTVAKEGGAIGVVVANNVTGEPIRMGGEIGDKIELPAMMISLDKGNQIKEMMKVGAVNIGFASTFLIEEPHLIDSITGFSSKGPRAMDYRIKPEVSAPGQGIISAALASGDKVVALGGTSMASPHIAGVAALLRQLHPQLDPLQIKSLIMNGATTIQNRGVDYPVSQQGAGRVDVLKSATLPIVVDTPAISLGQVQIKDSSSMSGMVKVTNISSDAVNIEVKSALKGMSINKLNTVSLAAGESKELSMTFSIDNPEVESVNAEIDGFVNLVYSGEGITRGQMQIPVLAYVTKMSDIDLQVSSYDPDKEELSLTYKNESQNPGDVLAFNYLGHDPKKVRETARDSHRSVICDLHSAGYRIVSKVNAETNQPQDYLQVAVKLHSAVSNWVACEVSVQIDREGDGVYEQELSGIQVSDLVAGGASDLFLSVLLDAPKVREIRAQYEDALSTNPEAQQNYQPAIQAVSEMVRYDYSTLAIVEAPLAAIAKANGKTHLKIATLHDNPAAIESDDFLGQPMAKPMEVSLEKSGFIGMPEKVTVGGTSSSVFSMKRDGARAASLLIYTPHNELPVKSTDRAQFHMLKVAE